MAAKGDSAAKDRLPRFVRKEPATFQSSLQFTCNANNPCSLSYNASMVRLETVLDSWKSVRADTVQALEDFPPGNLDFRPTADLMTFRELAVHILQSGEALAGMLAAGDSSFQGPDARARMSSFARPLGENPGSSELARNLVESVAARSAELATKSPEFYAETITRFDGAVVTRLEMLQFVKEHELTHRAQMFLCLRLNGIVPPTTRRKLAAKK